MISPLSRLWLDKMDIYRYGEVVINGFTKSEEILIQTDVKCKYSKGSLTDTGEDVPSIINTYVLFSSLDTDIKEGDKVIVTQRNGRKISLSVGEVFPYSSHQEFRVKRDDKA